jgi:hypothetical protein
VYQTDPLPSVARWVTVEHVNLSSLLFQLRGWAHLRLMSDSSKSAPEHRNIV